MLCCVVLVSSCSSVVFFTTWTHPVRRVDLGPLLERRVLERAQLRDDLVGREVVAVVDSDRDAVHLRRVEHRQPDLCVLCCVCSAGGHSRWWWVSGGSSRRVDAGLGSTASRRG